MQTEHPMANHHRIMRTLKPGHKLRRINSDYVPYEKEPAHWTPIPVGTILTVKQIFAGYVDFVEHATTGWILYDFEIVDEAEIAAQELAQARLDSYDNPTMRATITYMYW